MRSPSRLFSSNEASKSSKSISPKMLQILPNPSHNRTSTLSRRNIALSLQTYSARKKLKFSQSTAVTITLFPSKKGRPRLSQGATIVYLLLNSKSWISTSKTTCVKALSAILNPQQRHQFCSSRRPTAHYGCVSITAVSTKSQSRIGIHFPSSPTSSISAGRLSTSHASTSAMVITYCG